MKKLVLTVLLINSASTLLCMDIIPAGSKRAQQND